jgi:hypothetical protein
VQKELTYKEAVEVQNVAEKTIADLKQVFWDEKQRLKEQVDALRRKYELLDQKRVQLDGMTDDYEVR